MFCLSGVAASTGANIKAGVVLGDERRRDHLFTQDRFFYVQQHGHDVPAKLAFRCGTTVRPGVIAAYVAFFFCFRQARFEHGKHISPRGRVLIDRDWGERAAVRGVNRIRIASNVGINFIRKIASTAGAGVKGAASQGFFVDGA